MWVFCESKLDLDLAVQFAGGNVVNARNNGCNIKKNTKVASLPSCTDVYPDSPSERTAASTNAGSTARLEKL